ncbi:hypothetical protein ABK040_014799 [Willaertia magna]
MFISWKELVVLLLSVILLVCLTSGNTGITSISSSYKENSNSVKTLAFPNYLQDITDILVKSGETYNNSNFLMLNNNPIYIFSLKKKNITKMHDLIGKRVAVYSYFEDIVELKFKYENISGIDIDDVDYIDCECISHSFEEFDAFIYDLNQHYLLTLSCFKNSKREYYNWNDFNIINLNVPYELMYSLISENVNNIVNDYFNLKLIQYDNMTAIQNSIILNSNNSIIPDSITYNFMLIYSKSDFGIVTKEQLNFLNYLIVKFSNVNTTQIHNINNTIPLQILYNKLLPMQQQHLQWKNQQQFIDWINNNFTLTFPFIDSNYYQCYDEYTNARYFCHTYHTSVTNQILYNDVTTFITIFFVFIYYLTLIPMVNKPSIKIRLSLPYLAPLFVFIANILLIIPIINRCLMIMMVVQVILVALIVGIYGLTLFRVVYLRNIYKIIESFSGNQIKFIKILTSKGSGIVITILFSLLYALFWFTIAMIITFTLKYRNEGSTGINSLFTLCVLVNVVLGTVCMIIEIILNVKTIRKEGLRNFLIFDDPFYQRFDLITLVIIFGVTLPMPIIEVRNHYSIAILRTVAYISVLFLSGGTTLIFEYYNLMVNFYNDLFKRNDKGEDKKDKESQLSELEQKLENASFYKLLKKYAEKEFSLENILLYDQLMILKAKHKENSLIFKEELNDLSVNYIQSFSKYEVNFPSKIKLEFSNVISENRDVTFNQLYDILKTDLMLNIGDTCKRLEKTNEYRQLMDFLTLQKENYIV